MGNLLDRRPIVRALLKSLDAWVVDGTPPPQGRLPRIADGTPYVGLVPAVDESGNARAGIRLPAVDVPVGMFGGWNFRVPAIGAADQLFGEQGSFHPLACTKDARAANGDSRRSLAERYTSRDDYRARLSAAAERLVGERFLLAQDVSAVIDQSLPIYDLVRAACT